jgi:hypothetical protein
MGVHESLDAGGQSQLRKWKYRRSVRVPTYLPKNTRTAAANFFPWASLYLPRGTDLQGKGKQRRLGGERPFL